MRVTSLQYPRKSHRKIVRLPKDSVQLAELMGIVFGDGGINNPWQLVISLNAEADIEYKEYVSSLLSNLFGIDVAIRKRPRQKTVVVVASSTTLVDFLVEKGAARGNKVAQQISVPSWIRENFTFEKAFVRGVVDTDGCLYIHKHTVKKRHYEHVGFCFTSCSLKLIEDVATILKKAAIKPHIADDGRRIYLYSYKAVERYVEIFGSSNPRILTILQLWWDGRAVDGARLESV